MKTLADRIKSARLAADLTQQDIADHFGIKRVSVTQWESGVSRPAIQRIPQLAKLLNTSEEWLLANKGEPPQPQKPKHNTKLDELMAVFPKLDPEDQDRLLDMMKRLSSGATAEE